MRASKLPRGISKRDLPEQPHAGTPYGGGPQYGDGGGDQYGYGPGYSYAHQAPPGYYRYYFGD